jgi:hypothetical protein
MPGSIYVITGRITRRDTHAGIHGLRVEAWDEDRCHDDYLGVDLTNRDGSFLIRFTESNFKTFVEGAPEVFLRIRDRDCRLIYDGRADRHRCGPGTPITINVELDPNALQWHLQSPVSWTEIDGPLVPDAVFDDIHEAIGLLPSSGAPFDDLRLVECATPLLEVFDHALRDAWETLQGDLDAAGRFRDMLKAVCASHEKCGCGGERPFRALIEAIYTDACAHPLEDKCRGEKDKDKAKLIDKTKPHKEADKECESCGCDGFLVDRDKVVLLVMATLHVSCGQHDVAKRYLLALIDQLCRFEQLGALHRASAKALLGDTRSIEHLNDLLEFLCSVCGRAGEHPCQVRHPLGCCDTCLEERLTHCIREAVATWCRIECYTVEEVVPARACPGDTIVIRGCHFGSDPGEIVFRQKGGPGPGPAVQPTAWSDDHITVVIPAGAGCGLVPILPVDTVDVCDRFLELRRTGCIISGFEGTSAEILKFTVKGHGDGECLEPGVPLTIRWRTCAADHVKIEIVNLGTGTVIAHVDPADANGRWDFTGTHFNTTVRLAVRITAEGQCAPAAATREISFVIQKHPHLSVNGIEVTQAIQYYRASEHLTDAPDRGADNSLRLVTNKTAWVRSYLRSGQDPSFDGGQVLDVNGMLTVERRVGGVWNIVASIPSQNGPVNAQASFVSYDAERGNIDVSLNFVVPASIMTGLLRFTVGVASPFAHCPGNTASGQTQVDVNLTQTLNAAFITIGYNGPDNANTTTLNLPAPTLAQCQTETSWAMTTYPLSGTPNVRLAGTFVTTTPLNDPRSCPGCCSPNWQPLLQQVAALVALDQAGNPGTWAYYGIVNSGIPVNVPGCNGWGATGGLAGQPITYAHEIGHQFGLPHARCGNAGNGNASYPVYEPYDLPVDPPNTANWTMASIGEYGVDINNGNIANPNDSEDFMSYCGPRWISLYTHTFLINAAGLTPQVIPTGSGAAASRVIRDESSPFERNETTVQPLVFLLGTIDVDGKVEVATVARLQTRYLRGRGRQTRYVAQLLDENGKVLSEDTVYAYPSEGCRSEPSDDCSCAGKDPQPILFKTMLNDVAPGASLRILKGNQVVWERARPETPPRLEKVAAAALYEKGQLNIQWTLDDRTKEQGEVWIRWSNDDGRTWNALTVGQKGSSVVVDADHLPAGDVRFQLMVHDGFQTVTTTTDVVSLPPRPPIVAILYPRSSDQVYAEKQLHLFGTATSAGGGRVADDQATWYVDGKEIARGFDVWVPSPGAGAHDVRLEVTAGGLTGSAAERIDVSPVNGIPGPL